MLCDSGFFTMLQLGRKAVALSSLLSSAGRITNIEL